MIVNGEMAPKVTNLSQLIQQWIYTSITFGFLSFQVPHSLNTKADFLANKGIHLNHSQFYITHNDWK